MLVPGENDGNIEHGDEAPVSSSGLREYVPVPLGGFVLTEEEKRLAGEGYELVRIYAPPFNPTMENSLNIDKANLTQNGYAIVIIEPEISAPAPTFKVWSPKAPLSSSYRVWRQKKSD